MESLLKPFIQDDTRLQVIVTALELFIEKGFQSVSMNDIVKASGLSKGGIYHHFDSKSDIVFQVVSAFCELKSVQLQGILATEQSFEQKILLLFNPDTYRIPPESIKQLGTIGLEFSLYASRDERVQQAMKDVYHLYLDLMSDCIEQAQRQGEVKPDIDARLIAKGMLAIFDGLTLAELFEPETGVIEEGNLILKALLSGIRC